MQLNEIKKSKKFLSDQKPQNMKISEIKAIMRKHKDIFDSLENYDKTQELDFQRKRIDITLSVATINKLKKMKEKTGKPISQIIEERIYFLK